MTDKTIDGLVNDSIAGRDPEQEALRWCLAALKVGVLTNPAGQKIVYAEIDRLKAENEKLRELLSLVWDYCRVDDNAVTEADLERKAYECREVLGE